MVNSKHDYLKSVVTREELRDMSSRRPIVRMSNDDQWRVCRRVHIDCRDVITYGGKEIFQGEKKNCKSHDITGNRPQFKVYEAGASTVQQRPLTDPVRPRLSFLCSAR